MNHNYYKKLVLEVVEVLYVCVCCEKLKRHTELAALALDITAKYVTIKIMHIITFLRTYTIIFSLYLHIGVFHKKK